MSTEIPLKERYAASMVLSGVGDALGYNHGAWEFESNGESIHRQVKEKGGLAKLDARDFPLSDDTIMHLATAYALIEVEEKAKTTLPDLCRELARKYVDSMKDMGGRAPGITCMSSCDLLEQRMMTKDYDYRIPFNRRGGGCGAAMRAMCIGLRFPDAAQERHLIAVSVESGRLTHHNPTGYLGGLAAALFTAYAVRGSPPPVEAWGHGLLETLERAKDYVREAGHCVTENLQAWDYFEKAWKSYLTERGILDGKAEKARFPERYGLKERERFYRDVAFQSTGGASGHDAPMIAYDALLCAGDSWEKLADHGFFHGGDSDSTAAIAAAWWGAVYGFRGVPERNYKKLEYRERLVTVAEKLFLLRNEPFNEG